MPALPASLLLLDIGPMEFLLIAAAAVMLFGGDLPDVMRRAGQWVARLRSLASDITRNVNLPDDVTRLSGTAPNITRELKELHEAATSDVAAEPPAGTTSASDSPPDAAAEQTPPPAV